MNGLIDIGLNLAHDSFDADRDAVLQRAHDAGVERFIITGTSVAASVAARWCADGAGAPLAAAGSPSQAPAKPCSSASRS